MYIGNQETQKRKKYSFNNRITKGKKNFQAKEEENFTYKPVVISRDNKLQTITLNPEALFDEHKNIINNPTCKNYFPEQKKQEVRTPTKKNS